MRELEAKQKGNFITGPHPELDFSLGIVIPCPTPCPLGLGTEPGRPVTALTSHAPSAGLETRPLDPRHGAVTAGSPRACAQPPVGQCHSLWWGTGRGTLKAGTLEASDLPRAPIYFCLSLSSVKWG